MSRIVKRGIALLCVLAILCTSNVVAFGMDPPGGDYGGGTGSVHSSTDKDHPSKKNTETNTETETETTYTYITFGNYPQTEIVSTPSDSGVHGGTWETSTDYIVDETLYNRLVTATDWDANGDITIDGYKYRRIKKSNATLEKWELADGCTNFYKWSSSDTYHYFKYEPIKWRILEQNGNDYFLLSEIVLDDQMFNPTINGDVPWKISTVRGWLNGYASSTDTCAEDYRSNNFIDTAFTSEEKAKIKTTPLENKDNLSAGIEGGDFTADKIYLLSENEVYGSDATRYGFASGSSTENTARQAKISTYAKAMGTQGDDSGNCFWWLRSVGSRKGLSVLVRCSGSVYNGGQHANSKSRGIRPALHMVKDSDSTDEVCAIGDKKYSTIYEAVNAAESGNTIVLLKNHTETNIVINKNITIMADSTAAAANGEKLVLTKNYNGVMFYVTDGATLTIDGTNLILDGGSFEQSGTLICAESGTDTVNLNSLEMRNNFVTYQTESYGGAIRGGAVFNLTDCNIHDCRASYGGGIYLYDSAVFSLNGGTISGNTAENAGGGMYNASNFCTFGGKCTITGNTANSNVDNAYIYGSLINIGKLVTYTDIGVTLARKIDGGTASYGKFTSNGAADDTGYFSSDTAGHSVNYNGDGYLEIVINSDDVKNASCRAFLTLRDDIDIRFKINSLGTGFDKSKLSIKVDNKSVDNITYDSETNAASCILKSVEPRNMDTEINVDVSYDGCQLINFNYSVKSYCDAVFSAYKTENEKYAKLNAVCEALLNYGKYAEDYYYEYNDKNQTKESTVNENHVIDFKNYNIDTPTDAVITGFNEKSTAGLSLDSTIKLVLNVVTDRELTKTEDGQNFVVLYGDDKQIDPARITLTSVETATDTETSTDANTYSYKVSVDLYANQLSTSYTLRFKDSNEYRITYSVYNYCYDAQNMDKTQYPAFTDLLKTLCKAIHNYSVAIQNYIN